MRYIQFLCETCLQLSSKNDFKVKSYPTLFSVYIDTDRNPEFSHISADFQIYLSLKCHKKHQLLLVTLYANHVTSYINILFI